jgi:glyoxylase-like metal-dependent hydrolase (beta-lactamase superfamily II)
MTLGGPHPFHQAKAARRRNLASDLMMFDLGPATVHRIVDLDPFALPFGFLFPEAVVAMIRDAESILAPFHVDYDRDLVLLGIQSWLLRTPRLNILIDSCVGEHKPRPHRAEWHERSRGGFLQRLAAAGVTPDEVDVVLCTHLHADHVGWNTCLSNGRWVPTFPKARYLIGRTELAYWQAKEASEPGKPNHGAYADSVLPIIEAGRCETVDDGFDLAAGMTLVPLPGHTPGQIGLCIDAGAGIQAFFCGDAIHSPVQVFRPEWASAFCFDPDMAIRQRRALLDRAADEGALVVPAHIRQAHGMRIERRGGGYCPIFA